jgi:hypothetical protein
MQHQAACDSRRFVRLVRAQQQARRPLWMRVTAAVMTVVMYAAPVALQFEQTVQAAPPIVDPRAPVTFVYAHSDLTVDAPVTYAQGVTGYTAINQDRGFKAFFGSTWAQIIATDIGGGFTADGLVTLIGDALVDGGSIAGGEGVTGGHVAMLRAPTTTPVSIGQHLGLTTWWWF